MIVTLEEDLDCRKVSSGMRSASPFCLLAADGPLRSSLIIADDDEDCPEEVGTEECLTVLAFSEFAAATAACA